MSIVSVIVPVYNGVHFIEKTLNHILNQTYTHIEVILVNDGSSDDSANLINRLKKKDSRIKVFHKKNGGVADARNFGIKKASGEFIAFCDQDDIWHADKLEKQVPLFKNKNTGMVYCGTITSYLGTNIKKEEDFSGFVKGNIFNVLVKGNFIPCCSVIVRKSVLNKVDNFDPDKSLMGVDDWHVWLKIALISEIDFVKENLCTYNFHQNNYSSNEEKMHIAELVCLDKIKTLVDQTNIKVNWPEIFYARHLHYIKAYIHRGLFRKAGAAFYQVYKIKPSAQLLMYFLIFSYIPTPFLAYFQKIKRKIMSDNASLNNF